MKRILAISISFMLFLSFQLKADEGMWLLPLLEKLNYQTMKGMGLKLSPEDIYSVDTSSLKDAIVIFGEGCTGEIISDKGLLMTNMHCGYNYIQDHSSLKNDYLKNGYWAKSPEEELPCSDLSVRFLVRIEDVTQRITEGLSPEMGPEEREKKIERLRKQIVEEVTKDTLYEAEVDIFYGRNQFYLSVYEKYEDVRLVGNPPTAISDFGSLTDNWMWPRHKADFALFRIYMSPDGKPAKYSSGNIPLKPRHHFPVSIKGVKEGDFTMILGYPGNTDRSATSFGLDELLDVTHPNRVKIRGKKLEIMKKDMDSDPEIQMKYASKYKGSSNYWKYSIGQTQGLKRLDVMEQKQEMEKIFRNWVDSFPERQKKFGDALPWIEESYQLRRPFVNASQYINEALVQGGELFRFASETAGIFGVYMTHPDNEDTLKIVIDKFKEKAEKHFKNYHLETDKKITLALIKYYIRDIPQEFQPPSFRKIKGKEKKFVDKLYEKSMFAHKDELYAFLQKPSKGKLESDIGFQIMREILTMYFRTNQIDESFSVKLRRGQRLLISGTMEMKKDSLFYPDANFTMRLTYGTVSDYKPRDAVFYKHYTTLAGVMEKEDSRNDEFIIPDKLKTLYNQKNYGEYAANKEEMHVCFITNNDITGGNSGSPVIGANGELVGLAFDGNWEAMTGDLKFEPQLQKTICVDTRYILFIIDKYAGARHLIEEMTIIR